jgi:Tfp pilus assembly protein PilX
MQTKHHHKTFRSRRDAGVALITALLLLFLMSSLLVGFCILLISNQQLAGSNNDDVSAFYGAEAGMEQLTANLGNLFAQTYAPTSAQITALQTTPPPPVIPGITFSTGSGQSGYTIALPSTTTYDSNGNPIPTTSTVKSGPYQGLSAFVTEYTLTVNARTVAGREVKLQRSTQTVGIPAFSFGIFCGVDCSFFAGPTFNFGGRVHTNGSLFLASQSTLTLGDKVDAYGDIIRTELSNGFHTAGTYDGTVQITTNPGSGNYRSLAMSEGSYNPVSGSANSSWPTISTGASPTGYNHNLIDGKGGKPASAPYSTGAQKLNLAVAILGNGATQAVDLNRRALSGESMVVTAERYYNQASLRILLSDNKQDIINLPCTDGATDPFDLSKMATPVNTWSTAAYAPLQQLYNKLNANGVAPLPLAASGATGGAYNAQDGYWLPAGYPVINGFIKIEKQTSYGNASGCGTWKDVTIEVLGLGYVGRNIDPVPQSFDGLVGATHVNPQWPVTDATHMQPPLVPTGVPAGLTLPKLPGTQLAAQNAPNGAPVLAPGTFSVLNTPGAGAPAGTCPDPHPYAVIRLERIRDNPSSVNFQSGNPSSIAPVQSTVAEVCGWDTSKTPPALPTLRTGPTAAPKSGALWVPQLYDFWPNVLFDTREGELRDDNMSAANQPTLNGTMHYIEIDGVNLANWFAGKIGAIVTTGPDTKDPSNASNNFVLYVSDRRGNYEDTAVQTITGGWPPLSYTTHETGEYGWTDIVNSTNAANGCPNVGLDVGEDENADNTFHGLFYYYGASQKYIHDAGDTLANLATKPGTLGIFAGLSGTGLTTNNNCATVPTYSSPDSIWPMMVAANANAARENPPLFFRRAIKIAHANKLTALGVCPGGQNCGLAIATENPVYVQGDYNANWGNNGFGDLYVASSISGDAVSLLSNNWNDVNSFSTPYSLGNRVGATSFYRMAILAGVSGTFLQPGGSTTATVPQDFGTDGGVHNFLRFLEDWNGTLNYRGSIVELYYSRQANATYKCCTTVYSPPTRGYNFDTDFLDPIKLPPRTPLFRDVNTTGWTRLMLSSQ